MPTERKNQPRVSDPLIVASFSLFGSLLIAMDERASSCDLSRSQYLRALVRRDLDAAKNRRPKLKKAA